MRSITVLIASILLSTMLLTAQALPTNELIRNKRQSGTMNCLMYGICGKPNDYKNYHMDKRYGPYYHNRYYQRRGHGHMFFGRHP